MELSNSRVSIVGAGLAGCLLAIFLARRKVEVTLYESRPDRRRQAVAAGRSINLSLSSRGVRALRAAGVFSKVEPELVKMPGRMIHPEVGESFFQSYGQKPEEFHYSLSRGGLNSLLLTAAEETGRVQIFFEHSCEAYDFETGRPIIRRASDAEVFRPEADAVISCDGANSALRRALQAHGVVEASEELLDHSYKELSILAGLEGEYRLMKEALHIWPRGTFMLIGLPNRDGSFTLTLFLPNSEFEKIQGAQDLRTFFEQHFSRAIPLIADLERDFFENPVGRLGTIRTWPWNDGGRVLLLGDAAHAIVPFHGQGMNCSFEDVEMFDRAIDGAGSWEDLFDTVAKQRKPSADAIAQMALENYVEMRDQVQQESFKKRKKLEWELEQLYPKRFKARYSMVMFYPEVSYAEAFNRGKIQSDILDEILKRSESANSAWVREQIESRLSVIWE